MEQFKEDQLAMCGRVVAYLAENADALGVSEVAADQAAEVTTAYEKVAGTRGGTAKRTQKLTEDAQRAKDTLLDLLPALLGPLSRVATRLGDDDLTASATLSAAQKSAATGFAKTLEGLELLAVAASRDTLGGVTEIKQNASDIAAFVSRDSLYKYILATLDEGNAALTAGGAAFPFTLHSGFAGLNTPSTFGRFNRAIAGKAAAYYATSGGGTAAWQRSLAALSASFLNTAATSRAELDVGAYHPYSGATGDSPNPFFSNSADLFLHPSTAADAPLKADGTLDNRYLAKVKTKTSRGPPAGVTGIASTLGYIPDANISGSISIIRNEELLLLRAEGLLATADKAGALAIINQIRVNSGGLAPTTLTTASSDAAVLTELLLQKRYSLLLEGSRWVDLRRYNLLSTLPLDAANHFVARVMPIPQGECLVRVGKAAPLAGPGC